MANLNDILKKAGSSVKSFNQNGGGQAVAAGIGAASPLISQGNHNVVGDLGVGIGGAIAPFNPLLGGAIMLGGTLINAATGSNIKEDVVKGYQDAIVDYSRPEITAQDNTQLMNQLMTMKPLKIRRGDLGTQGWLSHKLDDQYGSLLTDLRTAETSRANLIDSAVSNVDKMNDARVAMNYMAFGGPLYGYMSDGAIAYDMARDNLMTKMWNAQNKSQGGSNTNVFAKGGPMFDYDLGISLINAGGSHAENPLGGVPMGKAPDGEDNVVEEGESIFKDYVFSKRLPVPKAIRNKYKMRSTNFSDMFKEYLKKNGIDERENDPIAQNGLMAFASDLMVSQEMVRAKRNKGKDSAHAYPTGGKILHDPSKTKENYFNDLYAEGSDYMNAINWYNDPAHTKERDALIAAINAGNFDTDIEKINGYTVTPDNWYALATDFKKGPVHNAILSTMNRINNPARSVLSLGKDDGVNIAYTPEQLAGLESTWHNQELANGLALAGYKTPKEGIIDREGNIIPIHSAPQVASSTSPTGSVDDEVSSAAQADKRRRMAGLFANVGALAYNMFDPYKPRVLNEISDFTPISGTPIGEYAPIFHTDTRYNSNQLAQQAAAARNAIMNTTNPNRNAGLLAADYNAQVAQGDMLRKDAIADYETLLKTLAFNRDTSKYNSNLDLDVAKANMTGRQAHDSTKLQQEQYNVTNLDAHKRAKDAAFAQGISNIVDWFNANNRERDNLAMVGALRESGALASNDAMDLLYNYLAGVRPAKTKSKNGKK